MASDQRSFAGGYFALKLDDVNCGIIQKFDGGDITGEAITLPIAHDYYVKKQIGNVSYNEFNLQMGLAMGGTVNAWVQAALAMNYMRKAGEVQAGDFKRDVRFVREFTAALITEVGFPKCDGGGKDPAFMSLKFMPETIRNKKGSGKLEANVDVKQKLFLPCNFRLTIDGLEKACARVNSVDALTVKIGTTRDQVGDMRDYPVEPTKIDFPNLKITLSEEFAHDMYAWHEDFIINGVNDETKHKQGSLIFLDSTRQKSLLELTFTNLGIFKMTVDPNENNSDKIRRVTCEMYMENLVAKFTG